MKVLYLYSEVMGYTMAVIKQLVKERQASVHVIYWDKKKLTPFEMPVLNGVVYHKRSEMSLSKITELIHSYQPQLVYVSGRMDNDYLKAAMLARKQGAIVVSGFDAQWESTLKKRFIAFAGQWLYKRYFDYLWVAGPFQYEFARKIGYSKDKILWNLLSAEVSLFEKTQPSLVAGFNKQFIYVGRFAEIKGVDLLVNAFMESKKKWKHDWKLLLIGNGPLRESFLEHPDITVHDFLQPEELVRKTSEGGVFVLPSRRDAWGVVLHEYTVAGFPIICSDACGGHSTFVKHGYNGLVVKQKSVDALTNAIGEIIRSSDEELIKMSERSREVGKVINPLISMYSLISALKK